MLVKKSKSNKQRAILSIIFVSFMIPNVIVYAYHTQHEFYESQASKQDGFIEKGNEQFSEGLFFVAITAGYIISTIYVFVKPKNTISYYAILIGTVIIIIIYYFSKTIGMPIPDGNNNWILDNSTNWEDTITKISQQIFIIPLAMMLQQIYNMKRQKVMENDVIKVK